MSSILNDNSLSNATPTSFSVHGTSVVTCLSLLPDGRIITASDDHTIQIHSPSGEKIHHLAGHSGGVWCMDTYEDTLVTGSTDRIIRVWDMKEGRCTHIFHGHTATVRALQIVRPELIDVEKEGGVIVKEEWPKEPVIVSGSRDFDLRVWGLPGEDDAEYHPEFHASSDDPTRVVLDNPYHLHQLQGHAHAVRAVSARGRTCVSAGFDCDLRVWDIITGECHWVLQGHTEKVYSVILDLPRLQVYSGSLDASIIIWDLKNGTPKHTLRHHTSLVGLIRLTPSLTQPYLISGSADGSVCIFDASSGDFIHKIDQTNVSAISALACDDERIVFGGSGESLSVLDFMKGNVVKTLCPSLGMGLSWMVDELCAWVGRMVLRRYMFGSGV